MSTISSCGAASPITAPAVRRKSRIPGEEAVHDLVVHRRDIRFHNVSHDLVQIDVTVHNTGRRRSAPAPLVLESAPFGAFVRWRPLATLRIPSIEPGGQAVVTTTARAPRVQPIGDFDSLTPRRLLTATGGDDRERPRRLLERMRGRLRANEAAGPRRLAGGFASLLAPDVLRLAGRGAPHWAGNLNVFIGEHAVERHMARALRVYPGRVNLAMFMCGERPDAYAFHLDGADEIVDEWEATVFLPVENEVLAIGREDPLAEGAWVETRRQRTAIVSLLPPDDAVRGELEVHVRQRSTGKEAVVEFSLDAGAQGPGCYTV